MSGPTHVSPLVLACILCAPTAVVAELIAHGAEVDPESLGACSPHPLANLAVWAPSNPHCMEAGQRLTAYQMIMK